MSPLHKLLAEWFWTDRWMGSSGFLLPMEARGIYREMLTQAWRREARLPNDHEAIRRAIGATAQEWKRSWPAVQRYWRVDGDTLVNDTQLQVYAEAQGVAQRASERGLKGAQARAQARAQAKPEDKPPNSELRTPDEKPTPPRAREPRGKAHDGPRLTVWHWQHEDLGKRLGAKVDTFDLLGWYSRLEEELARTGESFADPWKWLTHRLYVDADLPLPSLMGRELKRRTAFGDGPPPGHVDWFEECQRLHGGSCDGHKGIHDEKIADAWCEHTPRCVDRAAHAIAVHREKGRVAS
jgi:uncharacterized protein YdaU (DUF1376 family)